MNRKSIFTLLLCALLTGFLTAAAPTSALGKAPGSVPATDPLLVKSSIEGNSVTLLLANLQGVGTQVRLTRLDNERTVLKKRIKDHNGYRFRMNLAQLDYGRYCLEVTKGDVTRKQVVVVGDFGVLLSELK